SATVVMGIFVGLAPAVLVIVAQAVVRVGRRALGHPALISVALTAFVALAVFRVPFPAVVAGAAVIGWALGRCAPHTMRPPAQDLAADETPPLIADDALHGEVPTARRAIRVLGVGLLAWSAPLVAVALLTGRGSTLTTEGVFFSGAALVTF